RLPPSPSLQEIARLPPMIKRERIAGVQQYRLRIIVALSNHEKESARRNQQHASPFLRERSEQTAGRLAVNRPQNARGQARIYERGRQPAAPPRNAPIDLDVVRKNTGLLLSVEPSPAGLFVGFREPDRKRYCVTLG